MTTTVLAAAMSALALDDLPTEVVASAKRVLLDTIGCIIAARETEMAPIVAALSGAWGGEMGAAYAQARLADSMDFNEGYAGAHFGCGAVGTVLAAGAHRAIGGPAALLALVAGFETGARITEGIGSYYVTDAEGRSVFAPVWGIATQVVFAAAAAAGRTLALDAAATARAYDLAASNSPVPIGSKWSEAVDLPNTKYCDAGWCAATGLFAALSAQAGATAVAGMLDGGNSLFQMLGAPNANPSAVTAGLGVHWHLPQVRFKSWPACGLISAGMAALQFCLATHGIGVAAIEAIEIDVVPAIVLPRFTATAPATFVSRQFSLPHAASMLILGLPPSAAWLSPLVADHPAVRGLREKIRVGRHDGPIRPDAPRPCAVRVKAGGHWYHTGPEQAAQPPSALFGDSETLAKFRRLVEPDQAEPIIAAVMALETQADLRVLTDAIAQARPKPSLAPALVRLDALHA